MLAFFSEQDVITLYFLVLSFFLLSIDVIFASVDGINFTAQDVIIFHWE